MRKSTLLIAGLTLSALLAGCVGTGPSTQQGAVAGGAIGALAGAIIGNNSRGGDAGSGALIGAAVGAMAGGTIGNSIDHQNGTIYRSEEEATTNVVVTQVPAAPEPPPPPAVAAVPPPPAPAAIWIPGYYAFDGYRNIWVEGHWEVPPPECHQYYPPSWQRRPHGYVYIRGYWR